MVVGGDMTKSEMHMTGRQRLQAIFRKEKYDRLPIWVMLPYTYEVEGLDVNQEESYKELVSFSRKYTDFIDRTSINKGDITSHLLFNHPRVKKYIEIQPDGMERVCISCGEVKFTKGIKGSMNWVSGSSNVSDNYVKDVEDLESIMQFPYEMPVIDMNPYIEKMNLVGEAGVSCLIFEDTFSIFHNIVSEADACIFSAIETDEVARFLDFLLPRQLKYYEQFLIKDVGEVFFISGAEYLTSPLGSPEVFAKLITPYNKAIVDLVHSYGKQAILHCHGNIKNVLGEIKVIGADALHPVEPAPMGDVDIADVRKFLGDDVILVGNIEYSDLAEKTNDEIKTMVKELITKTGNKNFILSPSCGMFESRISPKQSGNFIAMVEAGIEFGKK